MRRRQALARLGAGLLGSAGLLGGTASAAGASPATTPSPTPSPTPSATPSRAVWRHRAIASYRALQEHLYLGELYREKYPLHEGENPYSYLWPLREATAATLDLALVPGSGARDDVPHRFTALERYWTEATRPPGYASYVVPPLGGGGDLFYDDNAIVALELIRRYRRTGSRSLLARARLVFERLIHGWDTDPGHPSPGGVFWVDAGWTSIRAANATGLAAEVAAHLFALGRERAYLRWATRMYEWNRATLRSPNGLYWNAIDLDGTIDETFWIYNSGAMIGAAALLYRATHDRAWLAHARADADAALAYWRQDDRYVDQPAIFDAIFGKNLLLLHSLAPDPRYRQMVADYADLTWHRNLDRELGLFRFPPSGGGPYDPTYRPETLEQSAMIQLFSVLAWREQDLGEAA
ncbi:MAG TPA: glycoside hydrolase family 76 protein [Actinopolymorphaceae bacterium]